jgi:hypothetical protein
LQEIAERLWLLETWGNERVKTDDREESSVFFIYMQINTSEGKKLVIPDKESIILLTS